MRSVLAFAAVSLLFSVAAFAEITGAVTVIDGDTIEIEGRRLTLEGIDAPELGQSCTLDGKAYDCGAVAKTALLDLTAGAAVVCEPKGEAVAEEVAATCYADGYDLAEGMVYAGWALADRQQSARYVAKEDEARRNRRGMWRGEFTPPWE